MTDELRFYAEIAERTAVQLTDSLAAWTSFLDFAGKLYKWPCEDQFLIFVQRPDASACADYGVWNRMGRYIRRDSTLSSWTTPAVFRFHGMCLIFRHVPESPDGGSGQFSGRV